MPDRTDRPEDLRQLLAALRDLGAARDAAALRDFLPRLRAMARRHLPADSALRTMIDSEDLLQDGLLQLVRRAEDFRGATWPEFLAFVHAVLAQKAQRHARRRKVRAREFADRTAHDDLPGNSPTPSFDAMAQEDRVRLRARIEDLDEPYRVPLLLRLEGLGNAAIAARLGLGEAAVRQRLSRAVRMLQERW